MTKNSRLTWMTVREIEFYGSDGKLLWGDYEPHENLVHLSGDEFMVKALFGGAPVPSTYYFGLDNRATLFESDTLATVASQGSEPSLNGYMRQSLAAVGGMTLSNQSTHWLARSPIITFRCTGQAGATWGPVQNLFLATSNGNDGYLISTVSLNKSVTLGEGQFVNMRFDFKLKNLPAGG